jgi:hypothetical protein
MFTKGVISHPTLPYRQPQKIGRKSITTKHAEWREKGFLACAPEKTPPPHAFLAHLALFVVSENGSGAF